MNFPTILTLIRLILSPVLMPLLIAVYLPANNLAINGAVALVFIFFALTDFFDGYLARSHRKTTQLGRLLDPAADKFLVFSTLVALVSIHKIFFYWAIILIGREIFIMSLREISLEYGFSVRVAFLGKLKMAIHMVFISFVILNPAQAFGRQAPAWNGIELFLLINALFFSILSAFYYYRDFKQKFDNATHNTQ